MADWKKVAKAALLSDGRIDTKEVEILKEYIFADGKVDKSELDFLAELKHGSTGSVRAFSELFLEAVKSHMLADGSISDTETKWLRKAIFADQTVDADEIALLKALKAGAKSTSPEFDALYAECVKE
ncbi:TerB family tellurite resistance protein [Tuwongella immobilis]|uniref:Uncharacterized protein n=1 Tax=Tuwongella immobilis TaxID=692036 RepID=A0A6C2YU53_9BACT|nr:TerB family tellurite resistance protein [Tuwongella immobilis]VIP04663.1 Uncharacterized protein OS=Thioploca ingrica GN=THII_2705 PE=4 SV=1 [Tuwongella immobilis]VTS06687.1 Uncharacterized protein OS=Thioploca ingrica GN=THII_2705 PE=4 SV=1 [Tuwongella immobilis]